LSLCGFCCSYLVHTSEMASTSIPGTPELKIPSLTSVFGGVDSQPHECNPQFH
jgi:hypothetical protein